MNRDMIKQKRKKKRLGAATVELAICLPLIVLITFGGIEGASMIFTKQALVSSAYEGIKVAVGKNATEDSVIAATQSVLDGRLLDATTVEIDPTNFADAEKGTFITVTVSCPGDANSVFPFGPFEGRQLSVQAVMVKE